MRILLRAVSVALVGALVSGCATRFARTGSPQAVAGQAAAQVQPESLSDFMQKIRHLSANARPVSEKDVAAATLEARDPALAAALLRLAAAPTADLHRSVGERYRERRVLDAAYRHFNRAIALNPRDAAAYEGLARVWRDWGLPRLALADAHRATYYAPRSASARNTYGTVMQALGRYADARKAYELASWLEPDAAYAVNNLCYLAFLGGRIDAAIDTCQRALRLDPSLAAARNNLALAFAASGRLDLARTHFFDAGDPASGHYNTGIMYLAAGHYGEALAAFDAASRTRPTFTLARERARQLRAELGARPGAGGAPALRP